MKHRVLYLQGELYAGVWDSWGFSIVYCKYDNSFTINFIHWYVGISIWKDKVARENQERISNGASTASLDYR